MKTENKKPYPSIETFSGCVRVLRSDLQSDDHAFVYSWMPGLVRSKSDNHHQSAMHIACLLQDLATQCFHWDAFKSSCKKFQVRPGKFLRPSVGEFLTGDLALVCVESQLRTLRHCVQSLQDGLQAL